MKNQLSMTEAFFKKGDVTGTFLLVGSDHDTKLKSALHLAGILVCESGVGCGQCGPCIRVAKQQSEALLVLHLEKTQINIEQARDVLQFLHLQSISRHRVVIVDQAQALNASAANSLLKAFEEPPKGTVIFLLAPTPKHVLPTLRSRSMILKYADKDVEADEEILDVVQDTLRNWEKDPQFYLRPAFKERVKDRELAKKLAVGFQKHFRDSFFENPQASVLFNLSVGLERELSLGSRDGLLVFEEFWIRSQKQGALSI